VYFKIKEEDGRAYRHLHGELWEGGGTEEEIAAGELQGRERERVRLGKRMMMKKKGVERPKHYSK
jgi:hypothetical protein